MAQPTNPEIHIDAILGNISTAYIQEQKNFIATKVFPIVQVGKQSNKYYTYDKAQFFADDAQRRGDGTESAGSGYKLSTDSYLCDVYALHKDIGHLTMGNFDNPLDPMRDATEFITQQMLQRMERQWVTDYFGTSIWGTDVTLSGTSQWSDETGSNPIDDMETAKETILKNTGFLPNTLVLGYQVFRKLKHHPDIVDRIKYTSSNVVTADLLGRIFEIDRVLVSSAVKNTANENATASMSFTHGKSALVAYVAPRPGVMTPSAGYCFSWSNLAQNGGLGSPVTISKWYDDDRKAWRVEGESAWDNKVVGSDLGYFIASAVA
jgi:hypothetical protein